MKSAFEYRDKRILIVDDQRAFQVMLKTMLMNFGARDIVCAQNADEAIKQCKNERFDLLLVDYNLGSGQNGRQLFETLKSNNLLSIDCVFFLVTGDNSKAIVLSAIQMTPDDYLMKPFSQNELNLRIQKAFCKREQLLPIYLALADKNSDSAILECDKIINCSSRYRNFCRLFKAELLIDKERYSEARELLENFIDEHPSTQAQLLLGQIYYLEKQYHKAITLLTQLIKTNPMLLDSYDCLAQCFKEGGDKEQALTIIQKAIFHSHLSLPRQRLLAELALDTNSLDIAKEAFFSILMQTKHTIHQHPEHLINYIQTLVIIAKQEEDKSKQGRLLQEINGLFHRPNQQHPYVEQNELCALEGYSLASVHQVKGDEAKAKKMLLNSTENYLIDPDTIPEWLGPQLVHLLVELGEPEHAKHCQPFVKHTSVHGQKLLEINRQIDNPKQTQFQVYNQLGIDAFTREQFNEALNHFENALAIAPLNTGAKLNKIQACLGLLKNADVPWPEMIEKVRCLFKGFEDFPLSEKLTRRKQSLKKEFNLYLMNEKKRGL